MRFAEHLSLFRNKYNKFNKSGAQTNVGFYLSRDLKSHFLGEYAGLYSKHVPIVPVLVESWSGQVNSGLW